MWLYTVLMVLSLSVSSSSEIGSCPPALSVDDVCEASCNLSKPCQGTQLCCPTVCGGYMCVDAMTKRQFTDLVKPGRCPEYPGGVWVCSNRCTGDSDCPRALKCCANRCGALACQRPEPEPEPVPVPEPVLVPGPVPETESGSEAAAVPDIDARVNEVPNT